NLCLFQRLSGVGKIFPSHLNQERRFWRHNKKINRCYLVLVFWEDRSYLLWPLKRLFFHYSCLSPVSVDITHSKAFKKLQFITNMVKNIFSTISLGLFN